MKKLLILIFTILFLNSIQSSDNTKFLDDNIKQLDQIFANMTQKLAIDMSLKAKIKGLANAKVAFDAKSNNFDTYKSVLMDDLRHIKKMLKSEFADAFGLIENLGSIKLCREIVQEKFDFYTDNEPYKKKVKFLINEIGTIVFQKLFFLNNFLKADENKDLREYFYNNSKTEDILSIYIVILKSVVDIFNTQINIESKALPKPNQATVKCTNFGPSRGSLEKKVIDEMETKFKEDLNLLQKLRMANNKIIDDYYDKHLVNKFNNLKNLGFFERPEFRINEIALDLEQNQNFKKYLLKQSENQNLIEAFKEIDAMMFNKAEYNAIKSKALAIEDKFFDLLSNFRLETENRYNEGYKVYQQIDAKNKEIAKIRNLAKLNDSDKEKCNRLTKELALLSPDLAMCVRHLDHGDFNDSCPLIIFSFKVLENEINQNARNLLDDENVEEVISRRFLDYKFIDQAAQDFQGNFNLFSKLHEMLKHYIWQNYYLKKNSIHSVMGYKWEILVALWLNSLLDDKQKANLKMRYTLSNGAKTREFDVLSTGPKFALECKDINWKSYSDKDKAMKIQQQFKDEAFLAYSQGYIYLIMSRNKIEAYLKDRWNNFFSSQGILFLEGSRSQIPRVDRLRQLKTTSDQVDLAKLINSNIPNLYSSN